MVANTSMKLPLNFFAVNSLGNYSETGDVAEAVKTGTLSIGDAAVIQMLGVGGGEVSRITSNALSRRVGQTAAGITGNVGGAAVMGGGFAAHNVTSQLLQGVSPEDIDWQEVERSGVMGVSFGIPGLLNAATTIYQQAPKEAIAASRAVKAEVKDIKGKAIELENKAGEIDLKPEKAELYTAADVMHKTASIKAMDEFMGKNAEEAIKKVKESDMSDGEKKAFIEKIEESALYQQQLELTKDLQTAGDDIAKTEATKDDLKPSEGKVPLEGDKPSQDVKTPSVKEDIITTKHGEDVSIEVIDRSAEEAGSFRVEAIGPTGRQAWVDVGKEGDVYYVKQATTAEP